MPNWCGNQVTVEHSNPEEILRLYNAFNEGKFLQAVCPMPDPLPAVVKEAGLGSLPDWYNWRLQNWGCKWDIEGGADIISEDMLSISFDSPWAPPIIAYQKLVEQGFKVHAYYHEQGMCFMGEWHDGEDDYIEYNGADDIPENWFDVWNMGEYFAMLEEMEND